MELFCLLLENLATRDSPPTARLTLCGVNYVVRFWVKSDLISYCFFLLFFFYHVLKILSPRSLFSLDTWPTGRSVTGGRDGSLMYTTGQAE